MSQTGFGRSLRRFKLSPRIRLVVEEMPGSLSAAIGFFVKCGSRNEPRSLHGVTHLAEHLFFKGTSSHSADEISQLVEMHGGELNAYTDREFTCFHAWVPEERTQSTLNLISEMLFDSLFDATEFKKEKQVVIQELQGYEESADDEFADRVLEVPWGNHPLGARIAGFSKAVKNFRHEDVIPYIRDVFLTSEIVISVASAVDPLEIKSQVLKSLRRAEDFCWGASLKTRALRKQVVRRPQFKAPFASRSEIRHFKGDQAQLAFMHPAVAIDHRDEIVFSAIAGLLGAGSSSHLFREVRENLGLAYSTYAQLMTFTDGGLVLGYLATERKHFLEAAHAAAKVYGLISRQVSEAEINFICSMMEGSIVMSYEGVNNRMETIGRQEILLGRVIGLSEALKEVNELTLAGVQRVASVFSKMPCFFGMGPLSSRDLPRLEKVWKEGLNER